MKKELGHITAEVLAFEGDIQEGIASATAGYEQLDDTAKEERLNEIAGPVLPRKNILLRIKESFGLHLQPGFKRINPPFFL